jgi:integrase
MGFKLARGAGLLFDFVDFLDAHDATTVTTELALRWATLPAGASVGWWSGRLCIARCFARHMSALDAATEVPPTDLLMRLGPTSSRAEPYLYSTDDVTAMLEATACIRDRFLAATCYTLIGLLSATGIRVGEALRLDVDDVDWSRGVLVIRDSKFNRSREVPLHPTTLQALVRYTSLRDRHHHPARTASFFVNRAGQRFSYASARAQFQRVVREAGLRPRSGRCRPRLHDFRHAFACSTLEDWYRAGVDVQALLPVLSTYLGHLDPISTYWYLSGKPELLSMASHRLASFLGVLP